MLLAGVATSAVAGACGSQKIPVAQSDPMHTGAALFSQRCSGCHSLAFAAANGSAANVRSAMQTNGPNFNVRCERPIARVLYAIENGGFSGAIMPQNIVVGQDAKAVAAFVAQYAGGQTPRTVGQPSCTSQSVGTLPAPGQSAKSAVGSGAGGNRTAIGQGTNQPADQPAASGTSGTGGKGVGALTARPPAHTLGKRK